MSVSLPADKKIMRIALVGIRPADQVMLKGYLRVLLRLDTDLEWVSANSPVVDLFMVSQEFQNAESVQRILSKQNSQNVLYITRSPVDMGNLTGNHLTLPLKELEQLSQWLSTHIPLLNDNENLAPRLLPQETATPVKTVMPANQSTPNGRQTLDEIMAKRAKNSVTSPAPATISQTLISQTPMNASATGQNANAIDTGNSMIALLKIAEKLQQRQAGLLNIMQGNRILAYLAPDRQRIWVVNPHNATNTSHMSNDMAQDWQLSTTTHEPPIIQQTGDDAMQWLWQQGYAMPDNLLAQLVQQDIAYQITSWIKPDDTTERHDILKIQCVLEARAATLDEIIQTAEVPRALAMRTLAGLIVSGVMPTAVYTRLLAHATQTTQHAVSSTSTATVSSHTSHYASHSAVLDSLPIDTAPVRPTPETAQPTPIPSPSASTPAPATEMKGFLSRLRKKLGL